MAKTNFTLVLGLVLSFLTINVHALTYTAVADGNWDLPATWGTLNIPGAGDDVIIDGHIVYITNDDVIITNLTITNISNTGESRLEIKGDHTVDILGDFTATAENVEHDIKIMIYETAIVTVSGDMLMERSADNMQDEDLQLLMYNSGKLFIDGAFDYIYRSALDENDIDIQLYNSSEFVAKKASSLVQNGGDYLFMLVLGSAKMTFQDSLDLSMSGGKTLNVSVSITADLTVGKDLSLTNTGGANYLSMAANTGGDIVVGRDVYIRSENINKIALLDVSGTGSTVDIEGRLVFDAVSTNSAKANIGNDGHFYLAGNLERPNMYGNLAMHPDGSFYFDGTNPQIIPRNKFAAIPNDSLVFTQLFFENTSTTGLILDGDLIVTKDLTLTDGIINTRPDSLLIIADGANITSTSSDAYVDGPMMKQGLHDGSYFTFPVGDNGKYAPIGIDAIIDAGTEYTAEFIGCPPPVGGVLTPIKSVNQYGHWILSRSDGAAVGNINLHWDDALANGITDINSLEVAYQNVGGNYAPLGRGTVSGGVGAGVSGFISNDIGCPPPVGNELFVLSSTDIAENALPVELTSFKAVKSADRTKIFLEWKTASETNSDYFVIEKSYDGVRFHPIDKVPAAQNSTTTRYYNSIDDDPSKGNNYYRIQQVDLDQTMTFSRLVNVFMNDQEEVTTIYPNPVEKHLTVYSSTLGTKELVVNILDSNGQLIFSGPQVAQDGQIILSAANLNIKKPGIYFLNYEEGGTPVSLRFVKVK